MDNGGQYFDGSDNEITDPLHPVTPSDPADTASLGRTARADEYWPAPWDADTHWATPDPLTDQPTRRLFRPYGAEPREPRRRLVVLLGMLGAALITCAALVAAIYVYLHPDLIALSSQGPQSPGLTIPTATHGPATATDSPSPTMTPSGVANPPPLVAPQPTKTHSPTARPTPIATPTSAPTASPTPTAEPVPTLAPSPTPTSSPTVTPTPLPTATSSPAPTATSAPTSTPSPAPTLTPAPQFTPTPTP